MRQKEIYDGAIPSGNSTAADNLVRLARLTSDAEYLQSRRPHLRRVLERGEPDALRPQPADVGPAARRRSVARDRDRRETRDPDDTAALIATVREMYLPQAAVLLVPPGKSGAAIRKLAPFAEAYEPVDGKAAAYVCRDFTCQLPTTDPAKLRELLEEAISKP